MAGSQGELLGGMIWRSDGLSLRSGDAGECLDILESLSFSDESWSLLSLLPLALVSL